MDSTVSDKLDAFVPIFRAQTSAIFANLGLQPHDKKGGDNLVTHLYYEWLEQKDILGEQGPSQLANACHCSLSLCYQSIITISNLVTQLLEASRLSLLRSEQRNDT